MPSLDGKSASPTLEAPGGPSLETPGGSTLLQSEQNPRQTELCGSGIGMAPPTFPQAWLAPPFHGRSTNLILLTPVNPILLKPGFGQNLGQTELCGSRMEAILPSHVQPVQSSRFT